MPLGESSERGRIEIVGMQWCQLPWELFPWREHVCPIALKGEFSSDSTRACVVPHVRMPLRQNRECTTIETVAI